TELGVSDALDPAQNLDGGARHLGSLVSQYHGDVKRALAAYNAGAGAVKRYGGVPPYAETREYVRRVMQRYTPPKPPQKKQKPAAPAPRPQAATDSPGRAAGGRRAIPSSR